MPTLTFKPKQVTKKILSPLQDRAYDVVENRFGLTEDSERKTLEAIGKKYGITRERVRQIENAALQMIRKSEEYKREQEVFKEIKDLIENLGGIVAEDEFLSSVSKDPMVQNHVNFYLVLGDAFTKHKEDDHFASRWSINDAVAGDVHESLRKLYAGLTDEELVPESELIGRFLVHLKDLSDNYRDEEIARRWLGLSKKIARNPLGEWGKADSSNVKTRGVRDYAFLVMRKHGSPMHFREVAKAITTTFGKKTHVATCHNELIKDPRFVLVGRGMVRLLRRRL